MLFTDKIFLSVVFHVLDAAAKIEGGIFSFRQLWRSGEIINNYGFSFVISLMGFWNQAQKMAYILKNGRDERIRTSDPLHPMQMR